MPLQYFRHINPLDTITDDSEEDENLKAIEGKGKVLIASPHLPSTMFPKLSWLGW